MTSWNFVGKLGCALRRQNYACGCSMQAWHWESACSGGAKRCACHTIMGACVQPWRMLQTMCMPTQPSMHCWASLHAVAWVTGSSCLDCHTGTLSCEFEM